MQTAGINIVAKWDAKEVDEGLKALRDKISALKLPSVGSGGSKGSGGSGGGSSTKKEIDLIGQLRKSTNESLRAVENLTLAQGARAQATLREQTVYASLKDKLDQVVSTSRKQIDSYGRLTQVANQATRWAQNLGVTYGTSSKEFQNASERAKKLTDRLKEIDAATGRNFRNVGNYTGSIKGLTASLGQITREIPSTLNNLQTMFLSFSNNLPAVGDNIKALVENNKKLKAEGKPTQSVVGALGAAIFSWNTAMVIGIALLTKYGPALVDYIRGVGAAKKEQDELKKAQEESYKSAGQQIGQLTVLNTVLTSNTASAKAKKGAYTELIKLYPSYKEQLDDEYRRTGNVANVIRTVLIPAIIAAARARAYQSRIDAIAADNILIQDKVIAGSKEVLRLQTIGNRLDKEGATTKRNAGTSAEYVTKASKEYTDQANSEFYKVVQLQKQYKANEDQMYSYGNSMNKAAADAGNLKITGEDAARGLGKEAKGAKTEAQKLADAIKEVDKSLKGLDTQRQSNAIGDFEYLDERVKTLREGIRKLTEEFNVPSSNSVLQKWIEEARVTSGELRRVEMKLKDVKYATEEFSIFDRIAQSRDKMPSLDPEWQKLNKSITPDWDKLFDTKKAGVKARTYVDALVEQLGDGADRIIEMSKKLSGLSKEVSGAFTNLGSTIVSSLSESIGTAIGGGGGLNDILNGLLKMVGQWIVEYGKKLVEIGALLVTTGTLTSKFGGGVLVKQGLTNIAAGGLLIVGGSVLKSVNIGGNKSGRRAFADGGVVYGPTNALIGEYAGASSNPEVVAPLNKLKDLISDTGGGGYVLTSEVIKGKDLKLILTRQDGWDNR